MRIDEQTHFVPGTPRIAYDHRGDGDMVLFLHGIGGNRTNWHAQLQAPANRDPATFAKPIVFKGL